MPSPNRSRTARGAAAVVSLACATLGLSAGVAHAAPGAPNSLRAFTGGPTVALLWGPGDSSATQFRVYRDGTPIATVGRQSGFPTDTMRYLDAGAPAGQAVSYTVAGLDSAGASSPTAPPITVTRPAAANTTAVPTVTVDPAMPAKYASIFAGARTLIQDWYPKFADALAFPGYRPPAALTLKASNIDAVAYTSGTTITFDTEWLDDTAHAPEIPGALLHEMTHVIQAGYSCTDCGWVVEGLAVWATHNIYNDSDPVREPTATDYYTRGYSEAEPLLNWVTSRYARPGFVRALNITAHGGSATDINAYFVAQTGRTPRDLWTELERSSNPAYTPPSWRKLRLTGSGSPGLCAEVPFADLSKGPGTGACWDTLGQTFLYWPSAVGGGTYEFAKFAYHCLGVNPNATGSGSPLVIANCSAPYAETTRWAPRSTGLQNPGTGRCMQATANPSDSAHQRLTLATCSSTNGQKWTVASLDPTDVAPAGWDSCAGGTVTTDNAGTSGLHEEFTLSGATPRSVIHRYATSAGETRQESLGGLAWCAPAVAANADGLTHVFVLGPDGGLWVRWQSTPGMTDDYQPAGDWYPMGSPNVPLSSSPAVVLDASGLMELFGVSTDGAVWTLWQTSPNGGWSSWASLGGACDSKPVATLSGSTVKVFCYKGATRLFRSKAYVGAGWTAWAQG